MNRYRPKSIREKGLRKHLESLAVDYDSFVNEYEHMKQIDGRVSVARLARISGYSWSTVKEWVVILEEGNSNA